MSRVRLLLVDGVLHATITMLCNEDRISQSEAVKALFLDDKTSSERRGWLSRLYNYSIDFYKDKDCPLPVKFIPADEASWEVINRFSHCHKTDPVKVMQALVTKSSIGEFTRHIIRQNYGYATSKEVLG